MPKEENCLISSGDCGRMINIRSPKKGGGWEGRSLWQKKKILSWDGLGVLTVSTCTWAQFILTHVTKWGWFPIFSSSLSRKVRSVASPGLRHSSSCTRWNFSVTVFIPSRDALSLDPTTYKPVWIWSLCASPQPGRKWSCCWRTELAPTGQNGRSPQR